MINFKKIIQKINQKAFLRSIKMMLVTIPMSRAFSDFVIQIREAKKIFWKAFSENQIDKCIISSSVLEKYLFDHE